MTEDLSASGFQDESTFESVNSRFSQLELLGTHGHNVLARAKRYGRWYLLKGLSPEHERDEMYREALNKEFDIMMRLQHPGVVQAVNLEAVEGLGTCIVMEWVEGSTLKEWLKTDPSREERYVQRHQFEHRTAEMLGQRLGQRRDAVLAQLAFLFHWASQIVAFRAVSTIALLKASWFGRQLSSSLWCPNMPRSGSAILKCCRFHQRQLNMYSSSWCPRMVLCLGCFSAHAEIFS